MLVELEFHTRRQWRTWLRKHHAASPGIWLVFHKEHTGVECVSYEASVREALCFGWIDSLVRRLDENRYARKFTPRQPASKWSESNRKRWLELKAAGLLAVAGLAAAPTSNTYRRPEAIPELPDYMSKALRAYPKAWSFFQELAPTSRNHFVRWIHSAKRPDTRQKRIRESIALLETRQKLGLK